MLNINKYYLLVGFLIGCNTENSTLLFVDAKRFGIERVKSNSEQK